MIGCWPACDHEKFKRGAANTNTASWLSSELASRPRLPEFDPSGLRLDFGPPDVVRRGREPIRRQENKPPASPPRRGQNAFHHFIDLLFLL